MKSKFLLVAFLCGTCLTAFAAEETPLTVLRQQTSDALRWAATASEGSKKDDAIAALCDLYVVLRQDERYASSEMLQQDAAKLRRRLISIGKKREGKLRRDGVTRPSSLSSEVDTSIKKALANKDDKQPISRGAAAAGAFDTGWELVELIQRVVQPDFWDSQGGPGTIRYFAMRRVLVVRATTDVHEQIRDLLLRLPR